MTPAPAQVGDRVHAVETPALIVDLDAFEHNVSRMAAFAAEDPFDGKAFAAHWNRILADETIVKKTVLLDTA